MDQNALKAQENIQSAVPVDCTEDGFRGDHLGTSSAI